MILLFISILCSVTVGILFKKTKPSLNESFLMITVNYFIAALLSTLLFEVDFSNKDLNYALIIPLCILMPLVFYFFNKSVNLSGIIKTDISQRISLIIPISAAFLIFGENISTLKWIGILLGFLAVFLMLYKNDNSNNTNSYFLLLVFLGYGIIDVFFKQIAYQKNVSYTSYLFLIFCGSFIVSSLIYFFQTKGKIKLKTKSFFFGILLGILNFSNIYFYLKAHKIFSEQPSTVFAIMNFGVITVATIVGFFYFKEKLSKKNLIGLVLAIFAISFILIAQFNHI